MASAFSLSPKAGAELLGSAIRRHNHDAVHKLLFEDKVDPDSISPQFGDTMLSLAGQMSNDIALSMLLQAGADVHKLTVEGHSALRGALKVGHEISVKKLLEAGADPTATGYETERHATMTDAELASYHGHDVATPINRALPKFLVNKAVREKNAETLEALLKRGVPPDTFDRFGKTALMEAAENGFVEGIEILLRYKADTTLKTKDGRVAMHFAAGGKNPEAVTALFKGGAKMRVWDTADVMPLQVAEQARNKPVIDIVRKYQLLEEAEFALKASRVTKDIPAPSKAAFKKRTASAAKM